MTAWLFWVWMTGPDDGKMKYSADEFRIGKRIVLLQASLVLIQEPTAYSKKIPEDPYGRTPFQHPALQGLDSLSTDAKSSMTDKKRLAALAKQYGLQEVLRWLPRKVRFQYPRLCSCSNSDCQ
jgi:large subunit ribosomal protein L15